MKKLILLLPLLFILFGSTAKSQNKLYFCEDYRNGEEVGLSDRFTTGWLTVMLRTAKPIGTNKVDVVLKQISDANGTYTGVVLDEIPFDVQPDWDYTYFQDPERLKFTEPGMYRVTIQRRDGIEIAGNDVEIIPGSSRTNYGVENTSENMGTGPGNVDVYFCEEYKNGEEIGVSDRFTTGWLTVMTRTEFPIGVSDVELKIAKLDGTTENVIDSVPFTIEPDWTYIYFEDKENLKFNEPGIYRVTLIKADGTPLGSNNVEIISR